MTSPGALAVGPHDVLELGAELGDRVQGVHRALHDDGQVAPAGGRQLLGGHGDQVAPLEQHAAGADPGRRAEQLGEAEQHGRLAAAGLADHADELAGLHVEVEVLDRPDRPCRRVVGDREAPDLKNGGAGHGSSEQVAERGC